MWWCSIPSHSQWTQPARGRTHSRGSPDRRSSRCTLLALGGGHSPSSKSLTCPTSRSTSSCGPSLLLRLVSPARCRQPQHQRLVIHEESEISVTRTPINSMDSPDHSVSMTSSRLPSRSFLGDSFNRPKPSIILLGHFFMFLVINLTSILHDDKIQHV